MTHLPFSWNLRSLREDAGYTQKEFSCMLNIARQTYSNYENFLREPNLETVVRIAGILKVSLDTLLLDHTQDRSHYGD